MKHKKMTVMSMAMVAGCFMAFGQAKVDDRRMEQDIEVAENILSTLTRQQFGKRSFFPMEVSGSYMPGYGVTFRLPSGGLFSGFGLIYAPTPGVGIGIGDKGSYSYSYSYSDKAEAERRRVDAERIKELDSDERDRVQQRARTKTPRAMKIDNDSLVASSNQRFIEISKNFLADYGDVISQLKADEKIIITNRGEEFGHDFFVQWSGGESRRNLLSVEAKRDDIAQLKQGKITRDQFLSRLSIINTETAKELDPDLEVLSSMFDRLYREDLSKTFYAQGNVHYERLKDFGVIYYMTVYSSTEDEDRFYMPTVALRNVSREERDKKVKELYPKFESDLKENLVEYGRTLRSLKDDEVVMFNVKLTKCAECSIPVSIELSIKNSALKEYATGKASKEATLAKVNVKKNGVQ